jgi:preprotein translocase subunit YajC
MSFISLLQAAAGSGSMLMSVLPFGLIILIFYFFIIRPQNKKQKETEKMLNALKKGDKVVTVGGIHGVVSSTKEKTVIVKVDDNTKIEFSRNAIASVVVDKVEKEAKSAKDDKKADKTEETPAVETATETSAEENK